MRLKDEVGREPETGTSELAVLGFILRPRPGSEAAPGLLLCASQKPTSELPVSPPAPHTLAERELESDCVNCPHCDSCGPVWRKPSLQFSLVKSLLLDVFREKVSAWHVEVQDTF